jgi:hypothetical protein
MPIANDAVKLGKTNSIQTQTENSQRSAFSE